jgi:hypothetical protein
MIRIVVTTTHLGEMSEDGMTEVSGITGMTSEGGGHPDQDLEGVSCVYMTGRLGKRPHAQLCHTDPTLLRCCQKACDCVGCIVSLQLVCIWSADNSTPFPPSAHIFIYAPCTQALRRPPLPPALQTGVVHLAAARAGPVTVGGASWVPCPPLRRRTKKRAHVSRARGVVLLLVTQPPPQQGPILQSGRPAARQHHHLGRHGMMMMTSQRSTRSWWVTLGGMRGTRAQWVRAGGRKGSMEEVHARGRQCLHRIGCQLCASCLFRMVVTQ